GAKDYSKSKFVSRFSINGGIAKGLIVIIVTKTFSDQIAAILGARGETLALTSNYLKEMFLSAPFVILLFILEQFERA
ncbi:MATE family efflux transporter, partial [Staphylococcus aureus]|nr:MATE family efflux transporter [Staphylococcus aureus]